MSQSKIQRTRSLISILGPMLLKVELKRIVLVALTLRLSVVTISTVQQGLAVGPNRLAMSRALDTAFLNHQLEQLEKSVTGAKSGYRMGLAPRSGSWWNRRPPQVGVAEAVARSREGRYIGPGIKVASEGGNAKEESQGVRKARAAAANGGGGGAAVVGAMHELGWPGNAKVNAVVGRESVDGEREAGKDKDVGIIVVDASVALYQVAELKMDRETS